MGANIAGIYGAQIFRQDDRPRYRRGFAINIAVLAVGLSMATLRYIDDRRRRRRSARSVQTEPSSQHDWPDRNKIPVVPPSEDQPQTVLVGHGRTPVVGSDPAK